MSKKSENSRCNGENITFATGFITTTAFNK